jgi:PAS domain S-box-containing protein
MSVKQKPDVAVAQSLNQHQGAAAFPMESRLWERAFDSVPDLIAILDRQHRIVQVNQPMAEKLGRTPEQCVGLLCFESMHGTSEPPWFCPHALSMADGKEHTVEVHDDRLGGYFLVTATPLRDESGQIVGGVHVARDITEQKKAQETLRHLLESSDHERHLVSCEIHDGLAQQLAGAIMQFEAYHCLTEKSPARAAKVLALGIQLVREASAEARRLIGGLRPPQLNEGGVLVAVEKLVKECNRREKVKIEFSCNVRRLKLAPMLENTIFRIVQECVTNACRHSKSKKVKVEFTQRDDQLRIKVRDWGVGFKVNRVDKGHFGLEGIQERAKLFGGRAVIKSGLRKGTDVVVELPLHPVSL